MQFETLRGCLVDECPLVRVASVGGVSRLLNLFWELIPAATTAWLVTKLTGTRNGSGCTISRFRLNPAPHVIIFWTCPYHRTY